MPHDLAGRFHLWPESDVDPGEADEGKDRFFHAVMLGHDFFRKAELLERLAGHDLGGEFCQRHADGLADKRDRPRGARVDFQDIDVFVFDRELDVHQAPYAEFTRERLGGLGNDLADLAGQRE